MIRYPISCFKPASYILKDPEVTSLTITPDMITYKRGKTTYRSFPAWIKDPDCVFTLEYMLHSLSQCYGIEINMGKGQTSYLDMISYPGYCAKVELSDLPESGKCIRVKKWPIAKRSLSA